MHCLGALGDAVARVRRPPAELLCGVPRAVACCFRLGIARLVERVLRLARRLDRLKVGFSVPSRERLLGCTVSRGATGKCALQRRPYGRLYPSGIDRPRPVVATRLVVRVRGFARRPQRSRLSVNLDRLPPGGGLPVRGRAQSRPSSTRIVTWLILPVVICLSQRLSHACLSINDSIL